jgi:hypothetical protein
MRSKSYPLAILEYDEQSNILYYRVKQDQDIDLPEMEEMLRYVQEFMGPTRHFAVIDFGGSLTSSTEARKKYADSEYINTYRIADAFLVRSLGLKLVANFFVNVTKPNVRTKVFNDEKDAVEWLKKIKE